MFDLCQKVALITGGVSGLGLSYAKELLRNGIKIRMTNKYRPSFTNKVRVRCLYSNIRWLRPCFIYKGVTLSDIDEKTAKVALTEIENEFGIGKAIFIKTDVSNKNDFEAAFIRTIDVFRNVDILINNAGIYNDFEWEKEVDINIKGTINGILLGLESYLKKYKQGEEAVILNTSSIAGIRPGPWMPIYGSTKFAIVGMTQSWGDNFHFERTKVRVIAICPGGTSTSLFRNEKCALKDEYMTAQNLANEKSGPANRQSPDFVAAEAIKILKHAHNGSLWVVESGQPAYEYVFPTRYDFKNNVIKEV